MAQNRCDQAPEDSTWQAKCDIIKNKKQKRLVGAKPRSQPSPCIEHILAMPSGGHVQNIQT